MPDQTDNDPSYAKAGQFNDGVAIKRGQEKARKLRAISPSYRKSKQRNHYTIPYDSGFTSLSLEQREAKLRADGFVYKAGKWRKKVA